MNATLNKVLLLLERLETQLTKVNVYLFTIRSDYFFNFK